MIKRYASHFILLPGYGYLKQCVVEVEEGCVVSVFPLTEEIEAVEWFPGVIVLLAEKGDVSERLHDIFREQSDVLEIIPDILCKKQLLSRLRPYLLYPFDFTTMQPAAGTRHKQLL